MFSLEKLRNYKKHSTKFRTTSEVVTYRLLTNVQENAKLEDVAVDLEEAINSAVQDITCDLDVHGEDIIRVGLSNQSIIEYPVYGGGFVKATEFRFETLYDQLQILEQ